MADGRVIYPSRARIEATVAAARAAGIKVGGFEVSPDGTIRILSEADAVKGNAYDRWMAKRDKAA